MAGEIPPLNIQINLETSGVQAGVQATADKLKGVTASVETATSKFSGLKTVMLGTFASAALQKGLKDLEGFLKDSVHVAEEAQTSITSLATAMNNAKVNTEANRQAMEKSTQAMMNLGFTGNDARGALTKLVTSTGSVTQAQKLMGVAADYARLKHMDLATAATTLSRGTVGAARAFREYGITLDTNLPKNQAITKAFDELNQKIGGQAAAYAETYAGKMAILGAKTNELKEKVGTMLLPVLTKLSGWFIGSLEWLTKHKAAMEGIALLLAAVLIPVVINLTKSLYKQAAAWVAANLPIIAIIATIALVAAGFVWAWNKFDGFRHAVVTGMEAILDVVSFLLKAIGFVAEAFIQIETGPLRLFLKALGFFVPAAKTASQELDKLPKMVGDFFDGAATKVEGFKKTLESVKDKKINIEMPDFAKMLATAGGKAGQNPDIAGQAHEKMSNAVQKAADKAAAKMAAQQQKAQDALVKLNDQYSAELLDRQTRMDNALDDQRTRDLDHQATYDKAKADIDQRYQDAKASALDAFNSANEAAVQAHEDKVNSINQAAVDKRASIIQKSIDVMKTAFENATKIDLGSLFTAGGGTAGGLATGLQEQLDQVLQLQKDAGQLAAAGYSQSFIDQVLAKGTDVGDKMAQAVLNATPETAAQIKKLYGQIDTVSQTGLDKLAKTMNDGTHFATLAMAQEYAQVSIDLQNSLADEDTQYSRALAKAQEAYDKAITAAGKARDTATKNAQDALAAALEKSQATYDKMIGDISASTDKKLSALQAKIQETLNLISQLGGFSGGGAYNPQYGNPFDTTTPPSIPITPVTPLPSSAPVNSAPDQTTWTSGGLTFYQTNNMTGPADPSALSRSAMDMINYGIPITVSAPYADIYGLKYNK